MKKLCELYAKVLGSQEALQVRLCFISFPRERERERERERKRERDLAVSSRDYWGGAHASRVLEPVFSWKSSRKVCTGLVSFQVVPEKMGPGCALGSSRTLQRCCVSGDATLDPEFRALPGS